MAKPKRERVFLVAFADDGSVVERCDLSVHDYYDESHALIDDDGYRADRGVRRLEGEIFGMEGKLMQKFSNRYDVKGAYLGGRVEHEDGTINED